MIELTPEEEQMFKDLKQEFGEYILSHREEQFVCAFDFILMRIAKLMVRNKDGIRA
jgi:hypothetical protein